MSQCVWKKRVSRDCETEWKAESFHAAEMIDFLAIWWQLKTIKSEIIQFESCYVEVFTHSTDTE